MKKIVQTLSQKWPEYLIEAVVIVASILGAYALDNWHQSRINFKRSIDYHQRIIEDIDYLIEVNHTRLAKAKPILESIVAAVAILERGRMTAEETAIFDYAISNYGKFGNPVEQQLVVLDEMKSNGDLELIFNPQLRKELTNFNAKLISYEGILKSINGTITENQFYFDLFMRFKVDLASGEATREYDFSKISSSEEFINRFSRNANFWSVQVQFSNSYIKDLTRLKELVESELTHLQQ